MNILPYEIHLLVIDYLYNDDLSIYFVNKYFFSMLKHSKIQNTIIKKIIKKGELGVIRYINKLFRVNDELVIGNKLFESSGINNYLLTACKYGHCKLVKYFVECGADIHYKTDYALQLACKYGYLEIVKYLVKKGANINTDDCYAVQLASREGHLKIVKYLVELGTNVRKDRDLAFRWSVENNHLSVTKYLVELGSDVRSEKNYAIKKSCEYGYFEMTQYLMNQGANFRVDNDYAVRFASKKWTFKYCRIFDIMWR
ncbi:putative ankyrin repeat protein [Acanthamoeba castellanii mimivirus]|uniref:Putative ankyrin repeat protein R880 n=6 Tax=Mimivirus TaxID=315393 RepID=YR880_MIMIV|nr:putative ankyrin repeat protein [Acanthamoeba polyphaga mimivirus]Q5UQX8.1 RecName: Full=Putative ankyrin repeat protein R880 [Acanthamoeba polyphaga mimivirus]AEQ61099.1 ankyrin repeat-containing protein [Acanthamoeba castellanii mamavirus]AHA44942.1 putative ankyrin repeat protein [Hirudovirus strain Sangsue]ALR84518.1 ankyrin repeat-containing protein [Niemeyer virus]AMZ03318.1 putative ankyrin repeat protein [Mimivirus Bombay]EJN40496.1 ankyrin containing protein [Acanthamoeba polyphag